MSTSQRKARIHRRPPRSPIEADEVFVVKITASYARDFVARAQAWWLLADHHVRLQPIDPRAHLPEGQRLPSAAVRLIRFDCR